MSQEIGGLKPGKNYWLQFRYNARNCCGGTIDLTVRFGEKELIRIPDVRPVGETGESAYHFQNISFVPETSAGLLEFVATANGDATLLLDAVSLIEREPDEVVIENASFEATGSPVGVGYVQPRRIAGWEMRGGYGVNITGVGPFTDNGSAIDQDRALFLQGQAGMSQTITGLAPGQDYTLIYYVNARNCCGAGVTRYSVSFDGLVVLEEDIEPVGGMNPYQLRYMVVQSLFSDAVLEFASTPEGDHTLLLDNIRLVPGVVVPPPPPPPSPPIRIDFLDASTLRVSWDAATANFVLQSATSLPGAWMDVTLPVTVEGNENVVLVFLDSGNQFFRLFASN
jgi:hypothetical protein